MASRSYSIKDKDSGLLIQTIANVANCRLKGAEVENGEKTVTFSGVGASNTNELWPGMLVVGKGIPANTIVLSIDGESSFTMSNNATADAAGIVIIARGYLPEITTKEINIEHFRDLFEDTVQVGIRFSSSVDPEPEQYRMSSKTMKGVILPKQPVLMGGLTGVDVGATTFCDLFADDPEFAVSDHISHEPPRENKQKVSFVLFVCDDGALVPIQLYPNTMIAQDTIAEE